MLLVEPGGETKVGQLDVTLSVDQDVIGFDITASADFVKSARSLEDGRLV